MKPTRTARLFGISGASQEQFLDSSIEMAKKNLLQQIKDRGWMPIGDARVNVVGGYIITQFGVSISAVFVGKKKVLTMKPIKEPETIHFSRIN